MMSKLYDLLLTLTCMVGVIVCLRPELFVYVRNYLFMAEQPTTQRRHSAVQKADDH